jgi:hypothetical protein
VTTELKMGATYQHYTTKGLYQTLSVCTNTTNDAADEQMVLYFGFVSGRLFCRTVKEFIGEVNGQPRFKLLEAAL